MTGRGAGYCNGFDVPGYMNPGFRAGWGGGRGFGRGRGGFGRRNIFRATGIPGWMRYGAWPGYAPAAPYEGEIGREEELKHLKAESRMLERSLKEVSKRLTELEAGEAEE